MMVSLRIERLEQGHVLDAFDCSRPELNRFLMRDALEQRLAGASQTYVVLRDTEVVGYYTLVSGKVEFAEAVERLNKKLSRHPVPVMVLARLAVAASWQGRGLGSGLLKDAILRALREGRIAGIRAFAVHVKNDSERAFFERFDFRASPSDPRHLFKPMRDVLGCLASAAEARGSGVQVGLESLLGQIRGLRLAGTHRFCATQCFRFGDWDATTAPENRWRPRRS